MTEIKKRSFLLIFILASSLAFAQDFKAEFRKYLKENDTLKMKETLSAWEQTDPENPELFTGWFNYYFLISRKEVLSLGTQEPEGESLMLSDSAGQVAGFLGSRIVYDMELLRKGLDKIDEGIRLYPDRLDMRFGKVYTLGQAGDWKGFTEELVKTIRYSEKNRNEWTWTDNEKRSGGKDFFLSTIQDYQAQLYDTGDDALLENMRTIAKEVLKIYPDHVESLSNLSVTYILANDFDKGIEVLLKAEKIRPKDPVVLGNLAYSYKMNGNTENAKKYYRKVIKYGDKEQQVVAKQLMEELEGK